MANEKRPWQEKEWKHALQEQEWTLLHNRITEMLDRLGEKDPFGTGDYWLVDDNYSHHRHILEVQNLELLRPNVIVMLQAVLKGYPEWEIAVRIAVPNKEENLVDMGLLIYEDEIIDDLQRELLPEEFRNLTYPGSKPAKRPTASFP